MQSQILQPTPRTKAMSVNVALCGSIPRSSMLIKSSDNNKNIQRSLLLPSPHSSKSLDGAPSSCSLQAITSLTSRLCDGLAENNNRYGNARPTHLVRRTNENGLLFHNKTSESIGNNTNIIMRPSTTTVLTEQRQPLAQVFEAPAWAVPAKGEARLEVSMSFVVLSIEFD
jgi:hypothetical protein